MKYYTYTHVQPGTYEVVYVGKGCGGRAWDVTRCRGESKKHQQWMLDLIEQGYHPGDWVNIQSQNMTEEEAFKDEKELLHLVGVTRFNRQTGERQHQSKMRNQDARDAYLLCRLMGMKQQEVADKFGVSRAAIAMICTGKQWRAVTHDLRRLSDT